MEDADRRQVARPGEAALALLDHAFAGELLEQGVQRPAVVALDAEGADDLALARLAGVLGDEGEDFVAGRERPVFGL